MHSFFQKRYPSEDISTEYLLSLTRPVTSIFMLFNATGLASCCSSACPTGSFELSEPLSEPVFSVSFPAASSLPVSVLPGLLLPESVLSGFVLSGFVFPESVCALTTSVLTNFCSTSFPVLSVTVTLISPALFQSEAPVTLR